MRVRIALLALFLLPWVTAAQEIDGREGDSQNHLVWQESGTEERSGQAPDINTSLNEYRPRAHFEDAVSLMKMGKAEEAALGFRKAITQGSKDQLAYLYLGRMAYKLHRYSEAIWAIGESVRLHPRDTELLTGNDWIRLISSHGVLAHYSAAYKTCEEARRHLTDDKDLQGIHVLYAYGAEDWEAAERVHRSYRTGSAMPSLTGRLFELGEIAVKAGANYAALKHYSASYSFYEPIFGPSNCRHRRVLMDKVIFIYQALPLKPQPPAVAISATLQAQKHIERKEWSKATWSYKDAISLAPWWPDAVPRRFQWYIAEGMLSLPTAKWSMVISFFSGVMASGFAFGCAKDTVEFFNAGIGEVRFPVGEGFLLVISIMLAHGFKEASP